ncbi:hypothetical protein [Pseudodesulfovibrio sp.]|uniref:hypothetical protein n=1 Tax=unclassified Pseudodesulfovibrio TaxID=2661612 RepID=UPI003AFF79DF
MKLKVGIPFAKHGRITEATLKSVRQLAQCKDFEVEVTSRQGSNVPRARNTMINGDRSSAVRQKLEGFDWFLCVDADTGFTPDHVRRLLAHDRDIVSGAYVHKHDATRIVAGWWTKVPGLSLMEDRVSLDRTGLFPVDWAGAGFLLIRREVLERTPFPWFSAMEVHYKVNDVECAQVVSDDLGFAIKMGAAGETILLDADCRVEHVPHPNERNPATELSDALNGLQENRDTIIRNVQSMIEENKRLRLLLEKSQSG